MKEFNYFAPGSVEEALELMKEYEGKFVCASASLTRKP